MQHSVHGWPGWIMSWSGAVVARQARRWHSRRLVHQRTRGRSDLVACCVLRVACCLSLVACCLLLVACWLLIACCLLLVACCWLLQAVSQWSRCFYLNDHGVSMITVSQWSWCLNDRRVGVSVITVSLVGRLLLIDLPSCRSVTRRKIYWLQLTCSGRGSRAPRNCICTTALRAWTVVGD